MKTIRITQPEPLSIEVCQEGKTLFIQDSIELSLLYTDVVKSLPGDATTQDVYEAFRTQLEKAHSLDPNSINLQTVYVLVDAIGDAVRNQKKTSTDSLS